MDTLGREFLDPNGILIDIQSYLPNKDRAHTQGEVPH